MDLDFDIWFSIVNGLKNEYDSEAINIIMKILLDSKTNKVSHCKTSKDLL